MERSHLLPQTNASFYFHSYVINMTMLHLYAAEQQNINVKYQPAKKRNV